MSTRTMFWNLSRVIAPRLDLEARVVQADAVAVHLGLRRAARVVVHPCRVALDNVVGDQVAGVADDGVDAVAAEGGALVFWTVKPWNRIPSSRRFTIPSPLGLVASMMESTSGSGAANTSQFAGRVVSPSTVRFALLTSTISL
ncbi:hypothetical protein [Streptomyces virginiae]|uniref:hypothetical protein n=1 Tax=Streptomyces virginiae TaxID=1961 RepID=UPI0035DF7ACD